MAQELHARVRIGSSGPQLGAVANIVASVLQPTPAPTSPHVLWDVDVDTAVVLQARPRSATAVAQQVCAVAIRVSGVVLDPRALVGPVSMTETLGAGTTFSFSLSLRDHDHLQLLFEDLPVRGRIGTVFSHLGAPPGKATIDLVGVYVTTDGVREVPLVTGGIVENARQSAGPDGSVLTLNCIDARGRYDRRKVTLSLPPGHGLQRGSVLRRIAAAAGVTSYAFAPGNRMLKEVQLVDADWIGTADAILEPEGRVLDWDRQGVLRNPERILVGGRVDMVFRPCDLLDTGAETSVDGLADVPTRIKLTGTEQREREECGVRTVKTVTETFGLYAPPIASHVQDGSGVLTVVGGTNAETLRLTSRTTLVQVFECDDLIEEIQTVEAYYNPTAARYTLETDGSIRDYVASVYLFDSSAVADDGTLAFQWGSPRFGKVSMVVTTPQYDERGFRVGEIERRYGYVHRRAHVKARGVSTDPWESIAFIQDREILANGEGVSFGVEAGVFGGDRGTRFAPSTGDTRPAIFEERKVVIDVSDDGYELGRTTVEYGWLARTGQAYEYGDGTHRSQSVEEFQARAQEIVTYVEVSEGRIKRITRKLDQDGRLAPDGQITEDVEGYLPAAERRSDIVPPASTFDSDEEAEHAAAASRFEQESIKCEVRSTMLEALHEIYEVVGSSQWAEDESELCSQAVVMLREGSALNCTVHLPANWLVRKGMVVWVDDFEELGLLHPVHVQSVTIEDPDESQAAITTTIQGRIYVV
jgi:hypothetical protein